MSNLFIVSGPSGVGEDSVIQGLQKILPIERVVTTTTRRMRPGDSQGNPYYFVTREVFEQGIATGSFVEYAKEYNDQLYGVTKEELDRVISDRTIGIWKIEYKGVMSAKRLFPGIVAILITAPLDILEKRIRNRDNPSEESLKERMDYTKEWLKHTDIYDYSVENKEGKLDETIEKVAAIIRQHADLS